MRPTWKPSATAFLALALFSSSSFAADDLAAAPGDDAIQGSPWTGAAGVEETVEQIMTREAARPRRPESVRTFVEPELTLRDLARRPNPDAPAVSRWPIGELPAFERVLAPQTVGTSFLGANVAATPGFVPPDTMGDVGPTQVVVVVNGRIRVFSKTGTLGTLNAGLDTFFGSVGGALGTTDPRVRYDRLSGRWFVVAITVNQPNRVLIAMSGGPTITNTASFTFFQFQHDLVGTTPNSDTGGFADFSTLGVDRHALYVGANVTNASATAFVGSTAYVIRKSDLLAGAVTVTAFRQLSDFATNPGPFAPQGADNDDPNATQGFIVGVDALTYSRLAIRRVSNPGGAPTLSGNLFVTVPTTTDAIGVPHQGAPASRLLDALDDRLFNATMNLDKRTGVVSLWTAHNFQVNASGVASASGGRNGSRWYELRNLSGTPTLHQSGTLFDPAAATPRHFWIPSVVATGQGHMAIGTSAAGSGRFAEIAVAGRLAGDPPGTTQGFTIAQTSGTSYNAEPNNFQRWGDYSQTVVDPTDDMTVWTFQQYCDTTNSWGVRAIQLRAPAPATPSAVAPSAVCRGLGSVSVVVDGTTSAGSGFFDPGPDAGGPGFARRIGAVITGGVAVNAVTFTSPTQVTLDLSTASASPGAADVTVTNPDGQTATGVGLLTILDAPATPTPSNDGPACEGASVTLSAPSVPGAAYSWSGPGGFVSTDPSPVVPASASAAGEYTVVVSVAGCSSFPATTTLVVVPEGGACDDANACTIADVCSAGTCAGTPGGAPDEVGAGLLLARSGQAATLLWDPAAGASSHDVLRGEVAELPVGPNGGNAGELCLATNLAVPTLDDSDDPLPGAAFWYLVRGASVCGVGPYGFEGVAGAPSAPRSSATCP